MSDENGRPLRFAGDPKLIRELIELNEAKAATMSDEDLVAAIENNRLACAERLPRIEEAQTAYQYPSQAFYVFDRILNRRRLNAMHPGISN